MPKFTFSRTSVYDEHFYVEAATEEEARELVSDGFCDSQVMCWIDWQEDEYTLEHVEDELVTFINSKETV